MLAPAGVSAQQRRQPQPPPPEDAYGSKFFDELRDIFGKFRNSDLQHVFETAEPIQCSELVANKGEWRTVAFFNEDRTLGEWCRNSLEEVKADLSVYTFSGFCRGDRGSIQVKTEFPVGASIEAYNSGSISLDQVDVNVNDPVNVVFDPGTQAYTFKLPYLFLTGHRSSGNVYSLVAPHVEDSYANDVTSRWECKAVRSKDVTYRFLICRAATVPRLAYERNRTWKPAFGASAYFILSDGMEARTSVNLSFGGAAPPPDNSRNTASAAPPPAPPSKTVAEGAAAAGSWQMPDEHAGLLNIGQNKFRLRFNLQTWAGKFGSPEILFDQKMSSPLSTGPPRSADYCSWLPGATNMADRVLSDEPDPDLIYSAAAGSDASIVFELKTAAGMRLGTLRCFFTGTESAAGITFARWVSVVGGHLMLEIRK